MFRFQTIMIAALLFAAVEAPANGHESEPAPPPKAEKPAVPIKIYQTKRGTILVVSHDLMTLEALCDRLVWIDKGVVKAIGTPSEIIPEYRLVMGHTDPSEF